jgi:glucokinase
MGSATDPGRLIGEKGTQGQDRLCADALDLFVQVYGAEAGNLALRSFAKGGVYIGGGIAPKTLQTLTSGQFLESFCDKGRFAPFMRTLSIKVALNPNVGLLGAADKAHQLSTL